MLIDPRTLFEMAIGKHRFRAERCARTGERGWYVDGDRVSVGEYLASVTRATGAVNDRPGSPVTLRLIHTQEGRVA
jgi:hypothetical protein